MNVKTSSQFLPFKLTHLTGDATEPVVKTGLRYIPHCCNDIGVWGAGFTNALSKKWKEPERAYYSWAKDFISRTRASSTLIPLGIMRAISVEPGLYVVNMIGQQGILSEDNPRPVNYQALGIALTTLSTHASTCGKRQNQPVSFHCPKFGAGLAGGNWERVEAIITDTILKVGDVYIYTYDL